MRLRLLVVVGCVLVLLGGDPARGQSSDPTKLPLLTASQIKPLGDISLPKYCTATGTSGTTAQLMTWGDGGLGIGPQGLIAGGQALDNKDPRSFGQFTIPGIGGKASTITPCITIDVQPVDKGSDYLRFGGFLWYNNRLIVSAYSKYDGAGDNKLSHTVLTPTGSGFSTGAWQQVGTYQGYQESPAGFTAGWMSVIPQEWRASLGGPALTGLCCTSIIGRTSSGPSASVFDPDQLGRGTGVVAAKPVVAYPLNHPLANADVQNPYFSRRDAVSVCAIIPGTRTLACLGLHGRGMQPDGSNSVCYGEAPPCYDPADQGTKGEHAYPYSYYYWLYDVTDLVAVKNGAKQPYDPRPYATGPIAGMNQTTASLTKVGGAWDPATKRFYLMPVAGESPRVNVVEIVLGGPPPPPAEVCGNRIDDDGDGLIDEGCVVDPPPVTPPVTFEYTDPAWTETVQHPAQTYVCTFVDGAWQCTRKP